MRCQAPFPDEVRERAVRLVLYHQDEYNSQWAAIRSVADKIGRTAETLRSWGRAAERDQGVRPGPSFEEMDELKALRREVKELRRANTILRQASAYLAHAELDRPEQAN